MKLTDAIISMILKKGILYEAHNCDVEFEIPATQEDEDGKGKPSNEKIKIKFKADNMMLKIEKSSNA